MHDTQDHPHGPGIVRCADEGGSLASASRPALSASRVLAAFALTSAVEALIDARLAELRLVIPLLRPWRGRISGRRMLGARSPSEHGEDAARGVIRGVTRIDIEFEVDAESPSVVSLACHSTVRGRDLETTRTRIEVPRTAPGADADAECGRDASGEPDPEVVGAPAEAGLHRVAEWIEDALCVFAAEWMDVRRTETEPAR